MSTPTAKTPPPTSLPCNRYWTSLRLECKKCKDKMKCPMYLAHWKKHQKLMRRWIWAKMLGSVVPKRQRRRKNRARASRCTINEAFHCFLVLGWPILVLNTLRAGAKQIKVWRDKTRICDCRVKLSNIKRGFALNTSGRTISLLSMAFYILSPPTFCG